MILLGYLCVSLQLVSAVAGFNATEEGAVPDYIKTEMISPGSFGSLFDDGYHLSGVKSIYVKNGWWTNGIQFTYNDGTIGGYFGDIEGGDDHYGSLEDGEYIIEVSAAEHESYNRGLEYIKFKTDKGRNIEFISGGPSYPGNSEVFEAPPGYVLGGIHGRQGGYLDTIGVYWVLKQQVTQSPSISPTENNDPFKLSWDITMIPPVKIAKENGKHLLDIVYEISNRKYDVKVLEKDCDTTASGFEQKLTDSPSSTKGFLDLSVGLTVNQDELEGSQLWTANDDGGSFSFCVSTMLLVENGDKDEMITKKDTIFHATVTNLANFTIGNIETSIPEIEEGSVEVSYQGEIDAYQCNPDSLERENDNAPLGPFDILNICVQEVNDTSVVVGEFLDLELHQEGSYVSFIAISGGVPDDVDLVVTRCERGICLARVQLLDAFFLNDEPKPLNINGKVVLKKEEATRYLINMPTVTYLRNVEDETIENQRNLEKEDEFLFIVDLALPCKRKDKFTL